MQLNVPYVSQNLPANIKAKSMYIDVQLAQLLNTNVSQCTNVKL